MTDEALSSNLDAPRRAAVHLQHSIVRGDLVPGEKVKQNDWAKRLGISGVPLREALNMLTAQDVLQHVPRRGYFVMSMTKQQILQIYRLRIFIETEMVRDIRWPSEEEVAEMEAQYEVFHEELAAGHLERAHDLYRDLYFARAELSRLDLFAREARRLFSQTVPYRMANFVNALRSEAGIETIRRKDAAMLEAFRARDVDDLVSAVYGTLHSTMVTLEQLDDDEIFGKPRRRRRTLAAVK